MEFTNIQVMNFKNALRGMRNPKDSWHLSDSAFGLWNNRYNDQPLFSVTNAWLASQAKALNLTQEEFEKTAYWEQYRETYTDLLLENGILQRSEDGELCEYAYIGPADMKLAQNLIRGGSEHRKFMRQIFVAVDITAPLFYWKEFDTYKVGTTANSTSTMHTITNHPILGECFETDDYEDLDVYIEHLDGVSGNLIRRNSTVGEEASAFIDFLEGLRQKHLFYKEIAADSNAAEKERAAAATLSKKYWKELIRWLPESWLQTRTVTMTYENLFAMVHQRENHKLNEWSGKDDENLKNFIKFAKSLPYAEQLIFLNK